MTRGGIKKRKKRKQKKNKHFEMKLQIIKFIV